MLRIVSALCALRAGAQHAQRMRAPRTRTRRAAPRRAVVAADMLEPLRVPERVERGLARAVGGRHVRDHACRRARRHERVAQDVRQLRLTKRHVRQTCMARGRAVQARRTANNATE
eukprot:1406476-Pleurochrysis_carterae.AAC.1